MNTHIPLRMLKAFLASEEDAGEDFIALLDATLDKPPHQWKHHAEVQATLSREIEAEPALEG